MQFFIILITRVSCLCGTLNYRAYKIEKCEFQNDTEKNIIIKKHLLFLL